MGPKITPPKGGSTSSSSGKNSGTTKPPRPLPTGPGKPK